MFDRLLAYDKEFLIYLNNLGTSKYDLFWSYVTDIAIWSPLFIFFLYLLLKRYSKKEGLIIAVLVLIALFSNLILTEIIKESVGRIRPNNNPEIAGLLRILKSPDNFSFISGHASSSSVVTLLIVLFVRNKFRWSYVLFLWPILFCYSRIYVGVHYPSDIVAGLCLGIFMAFMFYKLYYQFRPRFKFLS